MSDLPAEVQDIINQFVKPEFKDVGRLVALRAILVERERCAKAAEQVQAQSDGYNGAYDGIADVIVAIRKEAQNAE